MAFKFENLEIWQKAVEIADKIYEITRDLPEEEKYGLIAQLRRAAISIASNTAEGSIQRTDKDFSYYLTRSLGSAHEVITQLKIAHLQGYISKKQYNNLYKKIELLCKKTNSLINTLKRE